MADRLWRGPDWLRPGVGGILLGLLLLAVPQMYGVGYPVLERAPNVLWLITGADKVDALARLRADGHSVPAGRISTANALVIADEAAAGGAAR